MIIDLIIVALTVLIYIPLAGILLYVWWKNGKGERAVVIARRIYLTVSAFLFILLFII